MSRALKWSKEVYFSLYTHTGRQTHTPYLWLEWDPFFFVSITILWSAHRFRRSETSLVYELAWTSSSCSFSSYFRKGAADTKDIHPPDLSLWLQSITRSCGISLWSILYLSLSHTHRHPPYLSPHHCSALQALKFMGRPLAISPLHPICKMTVLLEHSCHHALLLFKNLQWLPTA